MERIAQGRSATLTRTFSFTPTGTPTVALTRVSDGSPVTASAMTGSGASWTYTIPASSNTQLDTYVVTYTATTGGEAQTFPDYIEVAGALLFTVDEARDLAPLNDTSKYPDEKITAMRTTVEDAIEEEYGTALVPRFRRETFNGSGTTMLRLRDPVRAIRSASVGGVDLSVAELAAITTQHGFLAGYTWAAGIGNVSVDYEYGLDRPSERLKMDAILLARQWLVSGPISDRALGVAAPDGGFSFGVAVPGRNGSFFGFPDLDAVISSSPYRTGVA